MDSRIDTRRHALRSSLHRGGTMAVSALAAGIMLATPLSAAAAQTTSHESTRQMMTSNPASDLRVSMNLLTQEHVYLTGAATGAAIEGRDADFKAAAAELDQNGVAISKSLGSVYGPDAEAKFLQIWRAHIGYFVDYAKAAAAHDDAGKQKALVNLDGYRNDIDALLTGANPNLPKGSVAELFKGHVEHLTMVIDDQVAGNSQKAYTDLQMAAAQSHMIADPLSSAIVAQFPDKFGPAMDMPMQGGGMSTTVTNMLPAPASANGSNDIGQSDQQDDSSNTP
jgi:hypothetical protein